MENIKNIIKKFNITREEVLNRFIFNVAFNVILFVIAIVKGEVGFAAAIPALTTMVMQAAQFTVVSFFFVKIPKIGNSIDKLMKLTGKAGAWLIKKIVELVAVIKTKMSK